MDMLKTEKYKGHKIMFIKYEKDVRYWIDEVGEGRTGVSSNKDTALEKARRTIDYEG